MEETISFPPAMEITTSVLTGPFFIIFTVPGIWFLALIFTVFTTHNNHAYIIKCCISGP